MASRARRPFRMFTGLLAILGIPGLIIAALSLLALAFGLLVLARESDRPRRTLRDGLQPVLASWVRTVPIRYVGTTFVDFADRWRRASAPEEPTRLAELRAALDDLGRQLQGPNDRRTPLIEIVAMRLRTPGGPALASWPRLPALQSPRDREMTVTLLEAEGSLTAVLMDVRYVSAPELVRASEDLERSYFRLVLSVLGLSLFPLLCLIYMALQASTLRDRAAREAAHEATLDLANRTCHELGNVAFVLQNERRNLADHLDLIERFVAEYPEALTTAVHRAGLAPEAAERLQRTLTRELARRGLDPEVELRDDAALARQLCRQVAVCSDYIALTVRELDGYLRQSALPVQPAPTDALSCLDDALTILGPRLESAGVQIDRPAAPIAHRRAGETDGPSQRPAAPVPALRASGGSVDEVDGIEERTAADEIGSETFTRKPVVTNPGERDGTGLVRVLADRRLLVHALVNLLKNAVEAATTTERAPRIALSVKPGRDLVEILVGDNGPGIPPDAVPHLFDLGYSTKGAGRGRGLAIVRESIEAQGGRIEVDPAPGPGATFRILLPRAPDDDMATG